MSRIKELKSKYPELNLSFFDIMTRMDISKSNKYLPLFCKIFAKRFDLYVQHPEDFESSINGFKHRLISSGISIKDLKPEECYVLVHLLDYINNDTLDSLTQFMGYMERGLISNNDVMTYNDLESVKGALALASMKEWTKDLEGEIFKEFEDDKWLILRPLTFASSAKYGATTRWCTTYSKEKHYFEKYWRKGILVYFINKISGYKFAGYKSIKQEPEMSFWNAEDNRLDFLQLEIDDYLFPIIKKIFSSTETNKNICSAEIQEQVHLECLDLEEKHLVEPYPVGAEPDEMVPVRQLWTEEPTSTASPIYEQPDIA